MYIYMSILCKYIYEYIMCIYIYDYIIYIHVVERDIYICIYICIEMALIGRRFPWAKHQSVWRKHLANILSGMR